LCVGQKTDLIVNFGSIDPLLHPLVPIDSIDISSANNTVDPVEIQPMSNSGAVSSVFTAKKAGTDTIVTILCNYWYGYKEEVSAAQDTITIKVLKTCQYHYKLHGELNVKISKAKSRSLCGLPSIRWAISWRRTLTDRIC